MKIIAHRQNTLNQLNELPRKYGAEIDIRSQSGNLIIQHDPYIPGESFDTWISSYMHDILILNVKEEGLETKLIEKMQSKGIHDYFLLDQSIPFLIRFSEINNRRSAVRISEFESIETALRLSKKVNWVWVDCFTKFPLTGKAARLLKESGIKLCIVSPELHGRDSEDEILQLSKTLIKNEIVVDAVCTKYPEKWERLVGPID
jgi:hypothetical protein